MVITQDKGKIMNLGNFAFHNGRFVILIACQETVIGTVWTIMDLNNKAITHVNQEDLTAYTYKPRGIKPASAMSDKQEQAIDHIEQQLPVSFNGQTLADVSTFLGLFLSKANEKANQRRLENQYNSYWN